MCYYIIMIMSCKLQAPFSLKFSTFNPPFGASVTVGLNSLTAEWITLNFIFQFKEWYPIKLT